MSCPPLNQRKKGGIPILSEVKVIIKKKNKEENKINGLLFLFGLTMFASTGAGTFM